MTTMLLVTVAICAYILGFLTPIAAGWTVVWRKWVNAKLKPVRRMGIVVEFKNHNFVILKSNPEYEDVNKALMATEDYKKKKLICWRNRNTKDGPYMQWRSNYKTPKFKIRDAEGPGEGNKA